MKTVPGTARQLKRGSVVTFVADFDDGDDEFNVAVPNEPLNTQSIDFLNGFRLRRGDHVKVTRFAGFGSFPRTIVVNGIVRYSCPYG